MEFRKRELSATLLDGGGFRFGFFEWEAGLDSGAGVAGVDEPCGGEEVLLGLVFFDEVFGEFGKGFAEDNLVDDLSHEAVAIAVDVDAVV